MSTVRRADLLPTNPRPRAELPVATPRSELTARRSDASSFSPARPDASVALGDRFAPALTARTTEGALAPGPLSLGSPEARLAIQKSLDYLASQLGGEQRVAGGGIAAASFGARAVERDALGMTHVRLDRMHEGLRVFGEQVITHLDRDGNVAGMSGSTRDLPAGLGSAPVAVSAQQAIALAREQFGATPDRAPVVEKVLYRADDGSDKVGYRVELTNLLGGERPLKMNYLVDAQSGGVDRSWNQIGGLELTRTVKASASPNLAIPDKGKVESKITVGDDVSIESLAVGLNLPHSYKGDLAVKLRSPSGTEAVIHNRTGGAADDVAGTFDLSAFKGQSSKGEWTLTVEDRAARDVGTLKDWALEIKGTPKSPPPSESGTISRTSTPNLAIEDNKTVTSTIDIPESGTIDTLKLDLDLAHTYRGDLTVKLTSPDGRTAIVHDRAGGAADDLRGSFDLAQFAGGSVTGQWKLEVTDSAARDTGTLRSWGLSIETKSGNEPPPPPPTGTLDDATLYSGKVDVGGTRQPNGSWTLNDGTRGKGVETLDAKGASRPGGGVAITDDDGQWGEPTDPANQKSAVDAQYGAQMTYDFYRDVLGRNSIDGQGEKLRSNVHIGKNYVNAFWDGSQMSYGDGDGKTAGPLTTLDIAGHEITHGLTERTAGLIYSGESGGINESMSDIMGFGVEWYAAQRNGSVKWDWAVGEDAWTPANGNPNDALRYMDDPTKDGYSVDHYSNYPKQTEVHGSSGIMNNAFFLLANGGTNKTSKISVADGIGPEASLKIYGRALMFYMTPSTTFAQAREATIKAATDLYGADSAQVTRVKESWHAVGVG